MAKSGTEGPLDIEKELWRAADALRSNMDAAEYKHVVLGLIFLKYISDAFEERYSALASAVDNPADEYYLPPTTQNRTESISRLLEDPDSTAPSTPSGCHKTHAGHICNQTLANLPSAKW